MKRNKFTLGSAGRTTPRTQGPTFRARISAWCGKRLAKWLNTRIEPSAQSDTDFKCLSDSIRPGDVVLVSGLTRISRFIHTLTGSRWTHVALCIGRIDEITTPGLLVQISRHYRGDPDQPLLIEALFGRGTLLSPLSHYRQHDLRICRPLDLGAAEIRQVITQAAGYLGYEYDLRQIVDLGRYLAPMAWLPRHWRSSLFAADASNAKRCICSTMLVEAFAAICYPVLSVPAATAYATYEASLSANPRLATPRHFDESPYFDKLDFVRNDNADKKHPPPRRIALAPCLRPARASTPTQSRRSVDDAEQFSSAIHAALYGSSHLSLPKETI